MENVFSEKLLHPSGPNCLKDKNEPQQLRTTLHEIRYPATRAAPGTRPGAAQAGGAPNSISSTPPTMRATPAAVSQVNGSRNSSRPASAVSATPVADQIP
jgi:hypothetical protein